MKNILFYKYIGIENTEKLRNEQMDLGKSLNLLGTILIAKEGINGCISGEDENIWEYKKSLSNDKRFSNIKFKEGNANSHTFKKFHVRIKNEIVSSRFNADLKNKAPYIEPRALKKLLDNKEDVILLDARNNYEYEIGRFKDAVHLGLDTFREFPLKIRQLKKLIQLKNENTINLENNKSSKNKNIKNLEIEPLKNKKIITYCTGGVRCEKASALLKEAGFENVYQLHDGILGYGSECGNAYWEGKCFVFDERGAIDIDPNNKSEPVTQCALCHLPSGNLHNCAFTKCDEFFTACKDCFEVLKGCCSKKCRNEHAKSSQIKIPSLA